MERERQRLCGHSPGVAPHRLEVREGHSTITYPMDNVPHAYYQLCERSKYRGGKIDGGMDKRV